MAPAPGHDQTARHRYLRVCEGGCGCVDAGIALCVSVCEGCGVVGGCILTSSCLFTPLACSIPQLCQPQLVCSLCVSNMLSNV